MVRAPRYLKQVRVASPCTVPWETMQGNDEVRFCQRCEKRVYNLSAMNEADAEALLARKRFGLCVRYAMRVDGTVVTADCPPAETRATNSLAIAAASMLAMNIGCEAPDLRRSGHQTAGAPHVMEAPAAPPQAQLQARWQDRIPTDAELEAVRRMVADDMRTMGGIRLRTQPLNANCVRKRNGKIVAAKKGTQPAEPCLPDPHGGCDPKDPLCGQ